jgi:hypothetical protein
MGGELVLTARFPDRDPVRIAGFGDITGSRRPRKPRATVAQARSHQVRNARAKKRFKINGRGDRI